MKAFDIFRCVLGVLILFISPGHAEAQGPLQALNFTPSGAMAGAMNGVGWSFVPNSDLMVTAVSSTAPQVTFWHGENQIIATYAYTGAEGSLLTGPSTSFQPVSSLLLSAGQTYFISAQAANLNSRVFFFAFGLNGAEGLELFSTSPYISQFASYYLSSDGQWSSTTTPASDNKNFLLLGPNFQFQVVPEPTSCALLVLFTSGWLLFKRPSKSICRRDLDANL